MSIQWGACSPLAPLMRAWVGLTGYVAACNYSETLPAGRFPTQSAAVWTRANSQSSICHGNAAAARGRGSAHMAGESVPCRTEVTVPHAGCSCRLTAGGWLLSLNRSLPPACSRLGSHGAGTFALPGGHLGERACPSM